MSLSQAIFAAGCFWGVQAVFDNVPGVRETSVGYTGGHIANPSYEQVCTDSTGHAEAVKIVYDEQEVSYDRLLDVFFAAHNPTTLNRQGPDVGSQYRSAIFYFNNIQKEKALRKIEQLNKAGIFDAPIVTEVIPAAEFYPAENYHQNYLQRRGQHNCSAVRPQIRLNEAELRRRLAPQQYAVLRQKATEPPFSGKYLHTADDGTFVCAACGNRIFESSAKFASGCGWPSFDRAIPGSTRLTPDFSHGLHRTEVTCARCGSHLGHLFDDGPSDTGMRFCINAAAMDFNARPEK